MNQMEGVRKCPHCGMPMKRKPTDIMPAWLCRFCGAVYMDDIVIQGTKDRVLRKGPVFDVGDVTISFSDDEEEG